jgi:hypothetical protein
MIDIIAAAMKGRMVFLLIDPLKLKLTHLQMPSVDMDQIQPTNGRREEIAGRTEHLSWLGCDGVTRDPMGRVHRSDAAFSWTCFSLPAPKNRGVSLPALARIQQGRN